jgi:hypothetical protein
MLVAAAPVAAAPLSPSAQFAYNVAMVAYYGESGCDSVDAQIVPRFPSGAVAEFSRPGTDCFVYLSRDLAGVFEFPKTCKILIGVLATWHGLSIPIGMPKTCLAHELFLLNHPDYLRHRF